MSVSASPPALRSLRLPRHPAAVPRFTMAVRSSVISSVGPILTKLKQDCATPLPILRHVADAMAADMRSGLEADGGGDLPMILSFVDSLPTGNEKGLFYALDLGGTNFRVLRVQLGGIGERVIATEFEQVSIPQELMFGTSEELFDFIASMLSKFVGKEGGQFSLPDGRKREIGFTFSFPVKQTSIDSGILIKWTKGFAVSGTAGKDVVACLNQAMERQGLDMRVSALVNDTVGTLAGARYWDDDVMVAVILGTGTNACYVERVDAIPKLQGHNSTSGRTIINLEWGAFSNGLPLTQFDREMDAQSINPGEQIFEKTISGMYLGEIVRQVLVKMDEVGALFGSSLHEKLNTPFMLRTPDICAMQQDSSQDLEAVESILHDVAGVKSDLNARKIVLEVCDTIVKRGGRLAGAGITGILQKMEEDTQGLIFGKRTVVAMDGGLYEHYPQYRRYLQDAVTELLGLGRSKNIVIEHSKDGSGIGAALLAATNSMYGQEY
ncbi:hexokinase-2, chloroplastic isoform X2 [Diospyros lotus]|uniref:hexokinase-2, chloroplastic isoform X2 n=1 Tax=Diospyros lotus TaxID=55363 RepID=UPI00224F3D05|nr:hexokinase-2, chloroplastic isoform X2 [Diospyros lotus]